LVQTSRVAELPDFRIPHAEKIDWMIASKGWAIEPVAARTDTDPPMPGYAYSIGLPEVAAFPEVIVFGLTPVAASGLIELVVELRIAGTEIPLGVEVAGLYDGEQRAAFAPVDLDEWGELFGTGRAWRRGGAFEVVQLLWPDRRGFLPNEAGFDPRVRMAQPVIGRFDA
jgi:hypothetical protein